VSGGDHRWFKRSAGKKRHVTGDIHMMMMMMMVIIIVINICCVFLGIRNIYIASKISFKFSETRS